MGAHGERVTDPAQLKPALQRALASGKCAVIHVDVDPVKHMWAPGLIHFKKMHEEPKAEPEHGHDRNRPGPAELQSADAAAAQRRHRAWSCSASRWTCKRADFQDALTHAASALLIGLLGHHLVLPALTFLLVLVLKPRPASRWA